MPLTDTKSKRLAIIVVVFVTILGATTTFVEGGHALVERKTDKIERAARDMAAKTDFADAADLDANDLALSGVRPSIIDDAVPGELVVVWDVQKWGVHRCVTTRWDEDSAPVATRGHCSNP